MGRNSYLGGSTVIGPGSSWFSKGKKKRKKNKRSGKSAAGMRGARTTKNTATVSKPEPKRRKDAVRLGPFWAEVPQSGGARLITKAERIRLQSERRQAKAQALDRMADQARRSRAAEQEGRRLKSLQRLEKKRELKISRKGRSRKKSGGDRMRSVVVEVRSKSGKSSSGTRRAGDMADLTDDELEKLPNDELEKLAWAEYQEWLDGYIDQYKAAVGRIIEESLGRGGREGR